MRNSLFVAAFALVLASPAMAAGSSSSSSRPAPAAPSARVSDYDSGVKAVKAGDYPRALGLLNKVVQAEPRNADAWNYIGFSERKLGHFDPSLAAYQKALAITPDHKGANEYLGELYLQLGDLEKAQSQLSKLQGVCPSGCPEYNDLKKAVDQHQATAKKS
jgi:tetratricopeptide (TPR) repeat protein